MPMKYREFSNFLYNKFYYATNKHTVEDIRKKMGIARTTFYNWIEGEAQFPPELIGNLYNATHDIEFINFFLDTTDLMAIKRQETREQKTIIEEALDVASHSGQVVSLVQKALKDNKIDNKEKREIKNAINQALSELEELKAALENGKIKPAIEPKLVKMNNN